MKNKKYYKVVTKPSEPLETYQSAMVYWYDGVNVMYQVDKWSYPHLKDSKLFVFDSLRAAMSFVSLSCINGTTYIFEVEVKNPSKVKQIVRFLCTPTFQDYWKNRKSKKRPTCTVVHPPMGTIICDAVMLKKRVQM